MREWYERWQARRTFDKMYMFHALNRHKFNDTDDEHFIYALDLVRSVMHKDWVK
jgi:hypothetical protein